MKQYFLSSRFFLPHCRLCPALHIPVIDEKIRIFQFTVFVHFYDYQQSFRGKDRRADIAHYRRIFSCILVITKAAIHFLQIGFDFGSGSAGQKGLFNCIFRLLGPVFASYKKYADQNQKRFNSRHQKYLSRSFHMDDVSSSVG